MRKKAVFIMVVCLVMLNISNPVLGETESGSYVIEATPETKIILQENLSEPQIMNLHFNGGDGGALIAGIPAGNSSTQVPCQGSNTGRYMGTQVGTWSTSSISSPVTLGSSFSCSMWAKSDQSASNVYFHLFIRVNGDDIAEIWTESRSLSTTPTEITGDDSAGGETQLNQGDTISILVIYFADPQYFVGPAPDSTLLTGGVEYDTRITFTAAPITISVVQPIITEGFVTFLATYTDAFGAKSLDAHIIIDGIVDVKTLSESIFSPGVNGSAVYWNWDYKTDKARDGEYRIIVSICYGEDNDFIGQGSYLLKFPKPKKDEGILGGLGWLLPVIILVIIVVAAVIVIKVIRNRKESSSSEA